MYLYLESEKLDEETGKKIPTGLMNCRGKLQKGDDPTSFAKRMARNGYRVVLSEEMIGHPKDSNQLKGIPFDYLMEKVKAK